MRGLFASSFADLFWTKLRLCVSPRDAFVSLITPKWRKRKLQERILQLNKKLVLLCIRISL